MRIHTKFSFFFYQPLIQSVASALGNIINYTCAVTKLGPLCNRIGAHNTGTDGIGKKVYSSIEVLGRQTLPNHELKIEVNYMSKPLPILS